MPDQHTCKEEMKEHILLLLKLLLLVMGAYVTSRSSKDLGMHVHVPEALVFISGGINDVKNAAYKEPK